MLLLFFFCGKLLEYFERVMQGLNRHLQAPICPFFALPWTGSQAAPAPSGGREATVDGSLPQALSVRRSSSASRHRRPGPRPSYQGIPWAKRDFTPGGVQPTVRCKEGVQGGGGVSPPEPEGGMTPQEGMFFLPALRGRIYWHFLPNCQKFPKWHFRPVLGGRFFGPV